MNHYPKRKLHEGKDSMRRIIAMAALAAAALTVVGTASATTSRACVDRAPNPYLCTATTSEEKATSAIVNAGRFSTATFRLACTKGNHTAVTTGNVRPKGRARVIDWVGKADCTLTARFRSNTGPHAQGRVTLLTG